MSVRPKLSIVSEITISENGDLSLVDLDGLFRRYARYVLTIAHRIVGDWVDAEDLMQDVFLDAHKGLKKYSDDRSIKNWFAVVTTRHARRFLRRKKIKQMFSIDNIPQYHQLVDSSASPEQASVAASIYRILDTLPVNDRIAWTLRHIQGETLEQTAFFSGCSRATAHRRIVAARIALQEVLGDD